MDNKLKGKNGDCKAPTKKHREKLLDIGLGGDFMGMSLEAQAMKTSETTST